MFLLLKNPEDRVEEIRNQLVKILYYKIQEIILLMNSEDRVEEIRASRLKDLVYDNCLNS